MMEAVMLGREWTAISCVEVSSLHGQLQRLSCIDCKLIGRCSNQVLKQVAKRDRCSLQTRCFVSERQSVQNGTSAEPALWEASEGLTHVSNGLVAGSPDSKEEVACATLEFEDENIPTTDSVKDKTADDKFRQIRALCEKGKLTEALNLVDEHGLQLDVDACDFLLECAIKTKSLAGGKRIREHVTRRGLDLDIHLRNNIVRMYSECKQMDLARQEFDSMSRQTIFSWTILIAGYAGHNQGREALNVFQTMLEKGVVPDGQLLVTVLNAVAKLRSLEDGKRIHALIVKKAFATNLFVLNSVVDMYGKCGDIGSAREVFAGMLTRDVVTWNAIISGYARNGHGRMAFDLYKQMGGEGVKPNEVTFVCLLKACSGPADLTHGKLIHQMVIDSGFVSSAVVWTAVLDMYIKCGSIHDARVVFRRLSKRDVVAWTAMMTGCNRYGLYKETWDLFRQMQMDQVMPNRFTHGAVLSAYAKSGAVEQGRQMHADLKKRGLELDVAIGTNLVNMYACFGDMQEARQLFESMPKKILVTWAVLISGYIQSGRYEEATQLFSCMLQEGLKPNKTLFVNLLNACVGQAALEVGKWLQIEAVKALPQLTGAIEEAIVNMYSRCASSVEEAQLGKPTGQISLAATNLEKWEYITTVHRKAPEQLPS